MSEMAGGPPGDMHIYETVTAAFNVIGDVIFRLEVLSFVRRTWSLEPAWLQRDPSYKSTLYSLCSRTRNFFQNFDHSYY